jgi:hypothetical protein
MQANAGTAHLRGPAVDRAALHGLLRRVREVGPPLLAVTQVAGARANEPDSAET